MTSNPADTSSSSEDERSVSRRRFVETAGAAGAISIAGCAGQSDTAATTTESGDEVTVQMAMPSQVTQNADATRQALYDAGLPERITVDFLATSEISGDVASQYQQWISANRTKPDIFRMDSGWTIPFIARNQLQSLSDRLSQDALDTIDEHYFDAAVNTARGADGTLYGVPWQVGFPTVQYRKNLVESAGFDPEGENWATEPMSWQRFSQVVSQTFDQADVEYGFAWQGNDYEGLSCCTFNEFMTSWGGAYFGGRQNLFGPVGDRPITVNEEPVHRAIRMARTFVRGQDDEHALEGFEQISPSAALQWTEGPSSSAFMNGNAVALRYWPSAVPQGVESFGDDLGVMPIPYGVTEDEAEYEGTGGTSAALGGWHLTVNPNSENVDAAVRVLEATMDPGFRQFQFSDLDYLTADRRLFAADSAGDVWGPHIETLAIAGDSAIPRPVTVVWPDQSPLISGEVNGTLAGQKPPEDAMSSLEESLRQVEQSV